MSLPLRGAAALTLVSGLLVACAQAPAPSGTGLDSSVTESVNASARIHTELAAQYFARGMYAIALQEVQEALQAESRYAPAYNVLGLIHGQLREDAQAEGAFQKAIALSPSYSDAHNNYGWFLCERGRYAPALEQLEKAVTNALYATPEKALANAGACSLRQGDLPRAEDYLRRALSRAPNQPVALHAMAGLQLRLGKPLAARLALLELSQQGPLDAAALWVGVRAERALGDSVAEAGYASQLRRRYPNSQETYWLGSGQYHQPEVQP